ncbi:tripartite tricarboxylate transporter substrate binding protein [Polynucleobacter wuianus]|uniref:Bug family tripartite tricarboxylate transporter substrate binding protein n=1 Tax=Polynucleobacter wuianus TaxID=1743168 RepID=UPI001C0B75CC|nr:tripartite tricarboxylate transporter substrate-binding protein [Polynucleobacter wuianus]MBU3611043.1 tripartite tricarboxylate transporter substrate binding protein [Polynucleobacter wuianus]
MNLLKLISATVFVLANLSTAGAQPYPAKPVSLVVPYPAGGVSDVIARIVSPSLAKKLGEAVIVENIGGASGGIAAQKVLNASADGYLVMQGSPNELILGPLANSAIKFKSEDFRLVQMIGSAQIAFLVRSDMPVKDVDSFLVYAKKSAQEGKPLSYGSVGPGSFYHLLGEQLSKETKIPMTHVPYKGAGPALQDLIGGQIDFFLAPYGKSHDELAKQGRIKILAMLNSKRLEGMKDYPAITESKGLKGFVYSIWTGYFVKKETPEPIMQTLNKALAEVLEDQAVKSGLDANSLLIAKPLSLNELNKVYGDGTAQFRAIAKSINLQPQ